MLALTRKVGEIIIINDNIEIIVVDVKGDHVKIGINAPKEVKILRKEIFDEIQHENRKAAEVTANLADDRVKNLNSIIKNLNNKNQIK